MKKDFIVSKIDSPQDGSPYVFVAFTDPNESKPAGKSGSSYPQSPFTSPEDLMKNLPKAMSNMFNGEWRNIWRFSYFQNHNEGI